MKPILIYILLIVIPFSFEGNVWFNTVNEMKQLMKTDLNLISKVETYLEEERLKIKMVKYALNAMRESRKDLLKDINEGFKHAISHYRLLHEFTKDWEDLERNASFDTNASIIPNVSATLLLFPQHSDMVIVRNELLKLQKMYKLKTRDLIKGYINDRYSGNSFSVQEVLHIAVQSCGNKDKVKCREWIKQGLKLTREKKLQRASEFLEAHLEDLDFEESFEELCSGREIDERTRKKLKCYIWDNFHEPWLILQPVKMEVLSISPDIVRFYEAISNEEIEILKSLSEANLGRAMTQATKQSESRQNPQSARVAHNFWLNDKDHVTVERITYRIGKITGLSMEFAERLQVATYGIAGHYLFHSDWFHHTEEEEYRTRNRKATFMFYLSDVGFGGSTVFLHPGIAVKPIKGSAVFWHNLLPSGLGDDRTFHGACPVVVGRKWVANKWILETDKEMCKPSEYIGRITSRQNIGRLYADIRR